MTDAQRLSEAMEKRRLELRITWTQVAERASMSIAGIGAIRRGERTPTPLTRARIEDALEWSAGSVDAILEGGQPTAESGMSADQLRQEIADLEDEIQHLEVKYERNRPYIVAHLQRRLSTLREQLNSPSSGPHR